MIGFAGLSHLGIVSSAAAAAKGFTVAGFDPDSSLCTRLADGRPPVVEAGLLQLLRDGASRTRYSADASVLSQCDVIYISADVPTDDANRSDSAPVEALLGTAVRVARPGTALVVMSQVPPGFSRRRQAGVETRDGRALRLYYQVETLVFGIAVQRALTPERFMVGCADPAQPLPSALESFLKAFACPILTMGYESAELAKIAINHFLAASVAMTNTLAEVCEAIGADWAEIAPALRLDRRIGAHAYLAPGLGIGGGNIERDLATVTALAAQHGTDAGIVTAIVQNSRHRRDWAVREVRRALGGIPSPRVAVWGLAYKPGTASIKNSPALALMNALAPVPVRAYDPEVRIDAPSGHVVVSDDPLDACRDADVLAVMTPWDEFTTIDVAAMKSVMRGRFIVDPFARLDGARCVAEGFSYHRLGRRADA